MAFDRELEYGLEREHAPSRTSERALFIQRTYAHLAGAILAFIGLEAVLVTTVSHGRRLRPCWARTAPLSGPCWSCWPLSASAGSRRCGLAPRRRSACSTWAWPCTWWPRRSSCLPLLKYAAFVIQDPSLIPTAGILTLAVFGGLTVAAFTTGKDFSMLYPILSVCLMIALGDRHLPAFIFHFTLGLFFSFAMVALMSGCILFQTSQLMHPLPNRPARCCGAGAVCLHRHAVLLDPPHPDHPQRSELIAATPNGERSQNLAPLAVVLCAGCIHGESRLAVALGRYFQRLDADDVEQRDPNRAFKEVPGGLRRDADDDGSCTDEDQFRRADVIGVASCCHNSERLESAQMTADIVGSHWCNPERSPCPTGMVNQSPWQVNQPDYAATR